MSQRAPFSFRELLKSQEIDPDWFDSRMQGQFETVDRMAALLGDYTFQELFDQPLSGVIPKLQANIDQARSGVFRDPDTLKSRLGKLATMANEDSFSDLAHSAPGQYSTNVDEIFYELKLHFGVHLPTPNRYDPAYYQWALRTLIQYAGNLTYMALFQACGCAPSPDEQSALYYAVREGILYHIDSGYCCGTSGSCTSCPSGTCVNGPNGKCATGALQCAPPAIPTTSPPSVAPS